ncbi:MAG: hypothetical protein IMY73_04805 [Bacteroidetes bacterium]|nr:hypothetical protein [Bacteroidota bacterium]
MKICRSIEEMKLAQGCVATMGSFDGLHIGHKQIFETLISISKQKKAPSAVITFNPHPRQVIHNEDNSLRLITTLEEKIEILDNLGVDFLILINFSHEFASLSYTDFVKKYLIEALNIKTFVVGYDHHFGKNREGSYDILLSMQKYFSVVRVDQFSIDENKISSTNIRKMIAKGDIKTLNKYLIESFFVKTSLEKGVAMSIDKIKAFPCAGKYNIKIRGKSKTCVISEEHNLKISSRLTSPMEKITFVSKKK